LPHPENVSLYLTESGAELYANRLQRDFLQSRSIGKRYILPKKNIATLGVGKWCRMIYAFTDETNAFLREYFQRNQSESGFSEDKKRTEWRFTKKREEWIDTAYGLTTLGHNLFLVKA